MFTGLIEDIGEVVKTRQVIGGLQYCVKSSLDLNEIKIGDSVSINGVCQTVIQKCGSDLEFLAMNKTLNFVAPFKGFVNIERAMVFNSRFGGHFVSGHIDESARILSIYDDGQAKIFHIASNNEFVINKGSVALNGISLTVCDVYSDGFGVSVLPHTLKSTNLQYLKSYDFVNVEYDMLGKYVKRYCFPQEAITREFLIENGF